MLVLSKFSADLTAKHIIIVTVWLVFTVISFIVLTGNKLTKFDKNNKLKQLSLFELTKHINSFNEINDSRHGKTIVHFSQTGCSCTSFSSSHIREIDNMAKANDFTVINKTLISDKIIPATPAVAIIDEFGELLYLGPYGAGLACSQTNGFAQTMLNNYLLGYSTQVIVTDAKGCYCHVT